MYCSFPSSRMRLSRSSRYFRRSASGSKARSVIRLHYAARRRISCPPLIGGPPPAGRRRTKAKRGAGPALSAPPPSPRRVLEVGGGLFQELGELRLRRLAPRGDVLGGP